MARTHPTPQRMASTSDGVSPPPFARSAREGMKVRPWAVTSLINYIRWWSAQGVSTLNKMCNILIFFREDVGVVEFTCDVDYIDKIVLDLLSHSVLSDLYVAYAFRGHVVGPLHAGGVIVVDNDRAVGELMKDLEVFHNVCDLLESFCTFVN